MMRTIAIDSGKYMTKAALRKADGTDKLLELRTKVDPMNVEGNILLNPKESHTVSFEGKRYVVGEAAHLTDVRETSKASDTHRVATYTAIAQLVDSGDQVSVMIGCPLSVYANRDKMIAYRDFMFTMGKTVTIEVDGATKNFIIRSAQIAPEGIGMIFQHMEKYGKGICGVVDIGGLNCNCAVYKNGFPVVHAMFTNSFGGNDLKIAVRRKLQDALETDLMDEILDQDLLQGFDYADKERTAKLISECKAEQVSKIVGTCQEAGWNVHSMPMIFTGGTSLLLKDEIIRQVPSVCGEEITDNVRYANVLGFLAAMPGGR